MVEIKSRETFFYEKSKKEKTQDLIDKSSDAKTFESWLNAKIKLSYEENNKEIEIILKSIKQKFKEFQTSEKVRVESWKGKSGIIKLIKRPDKIIAIKMQKPDKNSEPKEVRYEISREQLNALIISINKFKEIQPIKTHFIEGEWCRLLGYDRNSNGMPLFWNGKFMKDNFFAWRKMHNLITVALGVLDHEGYIEYVGGKTKILRESVSIQTLLG